MTAPQKNDDRTCPFYGLTDSVDLLKQGYLFAGKQREQHGNAGNDRPLWVRLLSKPSLLVRGEEGVRLFDGDTRVKREGAMPLAIRGSLIGKAPCTAWMTRPTGIARPPS